MRKYVYERTIGESIWSKSGYEQIFKFNRRIAALIGTMLTDDLKLTLETLEIHSSDEHFWFGISKSLHFRVHNLTKIGYCSR